MNDFYTALTYLTNTLYKPYNLVVTSIQEEKQNAMYGAGTFQLSSRTIRFRVANVTPKKTGQFVAFWEKDENNENQPYLYDEAPDLLVVIVFKNGHDFGQFVFPKKVLLKHTILKSSVTKGKMAMRVYPSWDHPTSKQAIKTQQWQLPYFIDMRLSKPLLKEKTLELYCH
ncbi:MepB family protein [Planococcus kocurii]|uniref:MepB family protein n=1 Tax=Planococcus kocurii TaxID=1374 RepID=UPI003CFF1CB6